MSEESDLLATITSLLASDEAQKEQPKEPDNSPIDIGTMMKLGSLLSDFTQEDERTKLLYDLKPFFSDTRRDKIDNAVKILRLLKIAEKAKNENLF